MRKRKPRAVVSFTNDEVMNAMSSQFYSRFADAGVKTGALTMVVDGNAGTVTFTQYEGDVT